MQAPSSGLRVSTTDTVARVVFDRPSALNALSPNTLASLIDACAEIANDETVKTVVFTGTGDSFSAGEDLPAFLQELTSGDAHGIADLGRLATNAVAELPQITVAGIRGHCVGGGLVLAGACDIRIATADVRFLIPELDAGIPLAWGGLERLIRLVGETLATDLVLSCRPLGADEALRAGLVSRVVPNGELDPALEELIGVIERKPKAVLRMTKEQLLAIRDRRFDARSDAKALLSALSDPEAQKAGLAYVARKLGERKP